MADNRCNEMSSSSSPTTSSSSPMNETNSTSITNESKSMNSNKNSLNAPKYGTPVPNRVFVGGIPTDTKESEVEQLFSRFGTVVSVKIISDRAGVPRGYGFVTFESEEDANKVMKESDSLLLKSRKLNVSVAIKKQQHFPNDFNPRVLTNGSLIYNPYALVNTSNQLYPEFGFYSSDGIPVYNMGVGPQMMANGGIPSPQSPYPYQTYQTSGLYLTSQPSMAPHMATQFQTSPQTYPLVSPSFRLPLTSPNVNPNLNMNQMNPYIHLSNTSTPPLSHPSSLPMQMGSVANQVMATDNMTSAINAINSGMSSLNFIQPPVYAISSNIPNSSPGMACVQNVQLKADNGMEMCADNSHLMQSPNGVSPQMLELVPVWPQRVANIQSPNKTLNRNQYSSKAQPNNSSNEMPNERPDRRNANSSSNASHNRKAVNNSVNRSKPNCFGYGYQNRNSNSMNANAAENQCQTSAQNHSSIPNTSALQGMPFVKTYYNNRYHTIPVTQQALNSCPPVPKFNSTAGPQRVTKMVNGVEIYAVPNIAGGDVDCYGYSKTPPLTSGPNKTGVRTHHK